MESNELFLMRQQCASILKDALREAEELLAAHGCANEIPSMRNIFAYQLITNFSCVLKDITVKFQQDSGFKFDA